MESLVVACKRRGGSSPLDYAAFKRREFQSQTIDLRHSIASWIILVIPSTRLGKSKYKYLCYWFDSASIQTLQSVNTEGGCSTPICCCLLFYVQATFKVISGWYLPTCDRAHVIRTL